MDLFWEKSHWDESDPHLTTLKSLPFVRPFPFYPQEHGIYVIRGPRQVGKSSWLKSILQKNAGTSKCFYLSCEQLQDYRDLGEVLKSVRGRDLILLDEISFVKDWARAIKHEADGGHLKIVVITGSNATDLRRGMERMPGRFGAGGESRLLPMEFEEFCAMRAQAGWRSHERLKELGIFFRTGGFPSAVAEAGPDGEFPRKAMHVYRQWLLGDFTRLGKQEVYLREILGQLALISGSPISLQKLAARTQLGSHHTAQEYVATLEDAFALRTVFAIDPNTGGPSFRKQKKFYFTDPLLYWNALDWAGLSSPKDFAPIVAEMVANEAIARRATRYGYYASKSGEVDFFCKGKWAIEVKWSAVAHNLSRAYLDLRIPEKLVWTYGNFLTEYPRSLTEIPQSLATN